MKTWQDGDPITYQDLNEYEKRKAFCNGTLDYTTLTYQEAVALQEELCMPNVDFGYSSDNNYYYFNLYGGDSLYATQITDYLSTSQSFDLVLPAN